MNDNEKVPYTELMQRLYESADRNPDSLWYDKITEFGKQSSRNNLRVAWRNTDPAGTSEKLVRLLTNNCPFDQEGLLVGYLRKKLPWTDWVRGINDEFCLDGTFTEDAVREGLWRYMKTNRALGMKEDEKYLSTMRTGGRRGRPASDVRGREMVSVASSFKQLYDILTDPASDKTYGRKYVTRSIDGRRGRHRKDQTFIRFDMRKTPVIMLRGKRPFSEGDGGVSDCYAVVGMERPDATMSRTRWLSSLKRIFRDSVIADGGSVDYLGITPCSLEYWMDQIERRRYTDTGEFGAATTRGRYFEKGTILDLREDGSYRYYVDGQEAIENWSPDPMKDVNSVSLIGDEYSAGTNESKKAGANCRLSLDEAKALTPEEKMDRWHQGTRKENVKACSDEKLQEYRKICRRKGYTEEARIINAELKSRKQKVNEALNYSSFIPEVQRELDGLVASLKDAKDRTERLMYGYEVTEDDYNEWKEIHSAVCKSLDKLPW